MPVRLDELVVHVPGGFWVIPPETPPGLIIEGLSYDSRRVRPGDLFFAIPGERTDGRCFISEARSRGAVAFIVEGHEPLGAHPAEGSAVLHARSARQVMGLIAALFHSEPSRDLALVGITGTDGKTSTTWLLRHILAATGRRAVAAGTLGIKGEGTVLESWIGMPAGAGESGEEAYRAWQPTTPEAPVFQETLAHLRRSGVQDVIVEVSSHALRQDRIFGTQFRAVAMTHVSADHLDFHGNREAYVASKARLFDRATRGGPLERAAVKEVFNIDDPLGRRLAGSRTGRCVTFGLGADAGVRLLKSRMQSDGMTLDISFEGIRARAKVPLMGRFHTENLLAASAIAHALEIAPREIMRGLATAQAIPGRFEMIREGQPFTVIVDYAHTADGLQRLLKAVRSLGSGRVVMVFGCGGDRDASKRAPMGRIAGELADHVILTSDNPRSEDPADIAAQVARGMEGCSASWEVVLDRREALTRAVEAAGAGDFLVAAGRGSESVQVFRDRVEPFDDREVLRDLLAPYVQRASQPGRTGERPQKMAGENGATVGCCATDCSARASDAVSPWSLGAIVRMTGGEVAGVSPEQWAVISSCLASGVALDSREVSGGEVFIALPGRRVDGHDFIAAAFAAGAQAALAQRARWGRVVEAPAEAVRGKAGPAKAPAETAGGERVTSPGLHIIVDDTLEAMQRWAAGLRLQVNPRVVAVTGSSGKTTTKEMILALLRPLGNVIGTVGNRNNEIGLPWTLLTLRPGVQWAVLEMGTNHPGEIETLSRLARPDVAVISCVGYAHEGFLGGREGVLKAKLEILTGLSPGGALVIPDDDPQLEQAVAERWNGRLVRFGRTEASDIRATEISYGLDGTRLAIAGFPAPLHLQLLGEGGARAALAALAVLRALGVESVDARVMEQVAALPGRLQPMRAGRVTWLLDMYNASPESTLYNLRFLEGIEAGGRKIFVFGGMQELGESSDARHREIGRAAGFCDTGFFVGPEARTCIPEAQGAGLEETFWCASVEDAIDLLRRHLDDGDVVLLKGARSSGLERIALELGVIDESCGEGGH